METPTIIMGLLLAGSAGYVIILTIIGAYKWVQSVFKRDAEQVIDDDNEVL